MPITKGSMRSFKHAKTGKMIMLAGNPKLKPWEQTVKWAAYSAWEGDAISDGLVYVRCDFAFVRPSSHFNRSGSVKPSALKTPTGDLDKLTRAVWDGLTGIVFDDDRRVALSRGSKRFGPRAGVDVRIVELLAERQPAGAK